MDRIVSPKIDMLNHQPLEWLYLEKRPLWRSLKSNEAISSKLGSFWKEEGTPECTLSLRCTEARPCEAATGRRQSTSQEGSPHQKYTGTCWHLNLLALPGSRTMGNQCLLFESHGLVVFYYHRLSRPIHLSTHLYMFHPFNILNLNKQ